MLGGDGCDGLSLMDVFRAYTRARRYGGTGRPVTPVTQWRAGPSWHLPLRVIVAPALR